MNNDGSATKVTGTGSLGYTSEKNAATTNVGTYAGDIKVTDLAALDTALSNYTIATPTNGQMKVTPKGLTLTVANTERTYGTASDTLGSGSTLTGFVNGDSVTVDASSANSTGYSYSMNNDGSATKVTGTGSLDYTSDKNAATTNAGTYTSDIGTTESSKTTLDNALSNYTITTVTKGQMTVDKATLTFNVDDKSKTYGDANPDLTGSFETSGFKNGDTIALGTDGNISSISLNNNGTAITDKTSAQVSGFDIVTNATQYSNVGNAYTITASGLDLTNYDVVYNQNNLTINKALLTYTVDDMTKTYGQDPVYTGTYDGLKGSADTTTLGSLTPDITGAGQTSSVGSYDLSADFVDIIGNFSNYDLSTNTGKLTITPADLYYTADGVRDYGVEAKVNDFTYTPTEGVSVSAEASAINDGKLKSWDSSSANNLSTLEGFAKNGTDALILYTLDGSGNKTLISEVTNVKFDSNNNIVGYELVDGSFTRADNTNQLGSLNYNWIFKGGSYQINTLPIPVDPPYQTAVRIPSTWGGNRTVQDTTSILFLQVISNGINVSGDRLLADDLLKYQI